MQERHDARPGLLKLLRNGRLRHRCRFAVGTSYSLDPRLAGRRVEVRVAQTEITAVALDTGELACRHRRRFARHLTLTDPAHQRELERLRGERRGGPDVEVERRPLARYDALISRAATRA
jgi:hypothetical protein